MIWQYYKLNNILNMTMDNNIDLNIDKFRFKDSIFKFNSNDLLFNLTLISWIFMAIFFARDPFSSYLTNIVSLFCLSFSILLIFFYPLSGLFLLPLAMLLGPIFHFQIPNIGFITIGDIYSLLIIFRSLLIKKKYIYNERMYKKHKIRNIFILLFFMIILILISTLLSEFLSASITGIVKIIQYALLYSVTNNLVTQKTHVDKILKVWVLTTSICSIVMLWSFYFNHINLISFMESSYIYEKINFNQSISLLRPAYFYSGFFIPLGLSIIYCMTVLTLNGFKNTVLSNIFLFLALCINSIALLLNNTKSMIFPVALVCIILILWRIWKTFITFNFVSIFFILIVFMILFIYNFIIFNNLVGVNQQKAFVNRMTSLDSLDMRVSIWSNVVEKLSQDIIRLLFGYGPQATARQGSQGSMKQLLIGTLHNRERAFDSTFIGLIVEYGIVFFLIVMWGIFSRFRQAYYYYKTFKDNYILLFLFLFFVIVVCHMTQQFGLSPAGLMVIQTFALLPVLLKNQIIGENNE